MRFERILSSERGTALVASRRFLMDRGADRPTFYLAAFAAYVLLFAAYFFPVLAKGEVIYPHDNGVQWGAREQRPDEKKITNDVVIQYIPALDTHLNGERRAWLATWYPAVQFGRLAMQLSGIGKAYLPTHLLSFVSRDAFVVYTALILLIAFFSGVFLFLMLKDRGFYPLVCAGMASFLVLGSWFAARHKNLPMSFTVCWTAALFWLVPRFIRKPSLAAGVGIAFATHSLFLTGYPQLVVLMGYFLGGFTLLELARLDTPVSQKWKRAAALAGCAAAGALAALPVFADLYTRAAFSGRWSLPDEYFHSGEIEGQVIAKALRFFSDFTPLFLGFLILGSAARGSPERRYWKACIAAVLLLMFVPSVRLFAAQYLGFGLSRGNNFLLYPVLVPACVLAAHAADHLFRGDILRTRVHEVFAFGVLPFYLVKWIAVPLWIRGRGDGFSIESVVTDALMIGAAYLFFLTRSRILFVLLVFAAVFGEVRLKTQPLAAIQRGSAIIDRIRSETAGGLRYGFIGNKGELLPPNMESLAGLRSIHSYDSLSSRNYQDLVGRLSEEGTSTFGRIFNEISSAKRLGDDAFTYTGIGLFISRDELSAKPLKKIGELRDYKFYRPAWPARLEAQTAGFSETDSGIELEGPLEGHADFPVVRTASYDDEIIFRVSPLERESVLFVSQQYHPFWRARATGRALKVVRINDFYQGVRLPPGTKEVTLRFEPFALWMWVPQALFAAAGLFFVARRVCLSLKSGKHGHSS